VMELSTQGRVRGGGSYATIGMIAS
jgi:hypothetical protein